MRTTHKIVITTVVLSTAVSFGAFLAEDTKGKWQFGFGLSYYATDDYIRSNSDIAISKEVVGSGGAEGGVPSVGSVDERPDGNMLNQATIQDSFQMDVHGSYGITRWLAVQLGASYLSAPVGKIEFYKDDSTLSLSGSATSGDLFACGPNLDQNCWYFPGGASPAHYKNTSFVPVGTVKELPIQASGLVRFRPESPFDPYIGLGLGYRMVDVTTGSDFNQKSQAIGSLVVANACEGEYTAQTCSPTTGLKSGPFFPKQMTVDVKNGMEWFAQGGVDYYINEKFSFYVDAKYIWNTTAVDIRIDDAHQVRFASTDQSRLVLTCQGGNEFCNAPSANASAWYLWEDTQDVPGHDIHSLCTIANGSDRDCKNDGLMETEDIIFNQQLDKDVSFNGNPHFTEDSGILYALPPGAGPRDYAEAIQVPCPACINGKLDTEDANGNGTFDRFLKVGYDLCTTQAGAGNPLCNNVTPTPGSGPVQYVWPEGCAQTKDLTANADSVHETGCPAFPVVTGTGTPSLGTTAADNASDVYLIQGGAIKLGGFSLGVGFKFTF